MIAKMTIQDASKVLGITVDAIRKRIQRKTIKARKNKQNRWIVEVDLSDIQTDDKDTNKEETGNDNDRLVQSLQEQIEYLRQENERKDHIIMAFANKQIEPPGEPREKTSIFKRIFRHEKTKND